MNHKNDGISDQENNSPFWSMGKNTCMPNKSMILRW